MPVNEPKQIANTIVKNENAKQGLFFQPVQTIQKENNTDEKIADNATDDPISKTVQRATFFLPKPGIAPGIQRKQVNNPIEKNHFFSPLPIQYNTGGNLTLQKKPDQSKAKAGHKSKPASSTGDSNVIKTWAGKFIIDRYTGFFADGGKEGKEYSASIGITFEPNEFVDATKIGFIQTAQSSTDGMPTDVNIGKARGVKEEVWDKVSQSRHMQYEPSYDPSKDDNSGKTIDQSPDQKTPVYGAESTGTDIADVNPEKGTVMNTDDDPKAVSRNLTIIGFHFTDTAGALQHQNASMVDEPTLIRHQDSNEALSQNFETTAIALEGKQKGTYYGSIAWGWYINADQDTPVLPMPKLKSFDVPSGGFFEAARLWNSSTNTAGEQSIAVPRAEAMPMMHTKSQSELLDSDQHTVLGKVNGDTKVKIIEKGHLLEAGGEVFDKVVVLEGRLKDRTGYINEVNLEPIKSK